MKECEVSNVLVSETPDGYLIMDGRENNTIHISHQYLNHVPNVAHRLLFNAWITQLERFYLDGFKRMEVKVEFAQAPE